MLAGLSQEDMIQLKSRTGWWFFTNPSEKYAHVKLGKSSPKKKKRVELPPPRKDFTHFWEGLI